MSVVMSSESLLVEILSGGLGVFTSLSWRCNPSISVGVLPISTTACGRGPVDFWPVSSVSGSRGFFLFAPRLATCVDTATVRSKGLSTGCCFLPFALPVSRPVLAPGCIFVGCFQNPITQIPMNLNFIDPQTRVLNYF